MHQSCGVDTICDCYSSKMPQCHHQSMPCGEHGWTPAQRMFGQTFPKGMRSTVPRYRVEVFVLLRWIDHIFNKLFETTHRSDSDSQNLEGSRYATLIIGGLRLQPEVDYTVKCRIIWNGLQLCYDEHLRMRTYRSSEIEGGFAIARTCVTTSFTFHP